MELRPWIREHDLTNSDFARLIRCRPQVVHKWIGGSIPDPKYMRRIYRMTRGKVSPNDFYKLPPLDLSKLNGDDLEEELGEDGDNE
jgi:hypothetical protein